MRFFKIITSVVFFFQVQIVLAHGQVVISGTGCVIAGAEYQDDLNKDQADLFNIQVCFTEGVIAGTDSVCRNASPFSFIRVIWKGIS